MNIYTKYLVECEKKEPTLLEKVLNKKDTFEIWAPCIINWFRDRINTELYRILTIAPTEEKMEVWWSKY